MPITYDNYLGLKRFAGLDGLRAIAALMVVTEHLADDFLFYLDGASGVDIFFVLSGFLITTLLLREEAKYKTVSIKAFYLRRTFRIFPIYYFVLGLYCFLIFVVPLDVFSSKQDQMTKSFWLYALYLGEFTGRNIAGFGHAWSLGIEEKFYLIWPLLGFIGIGYTRKQWRTPFVLFLSVTLLSIHIIVNPGNRFVGYYLLSIGCLLAVLLNDRIWYDRIYAVIKHAAGPILIIGLFAASQVLRKDSEFFLLFYPVAAALLIALAVTGNGRLTSTLELRPLTFCGQISYGIYLIHILAINAVQTVIKPGSGNFAVTTAIFICSAMLSVLLAWLMYRVIEKPMITYGRKLAANVKRPVV
jgi:peptidoglycan/LPS O-acetylase OafA/YrhL